MSRIESLEPGWYVVGTLDPGVHWTDESVPRAWLGPRSEDEARASAVRLAQTHPDRSFGVAEIRR